MVLSYPVFFTLYSISMAVGVFVGLILTVGWKDMYWRRALMSAKYNAVYLLLLAVLPLFIQAQDLLERSLAGPGEATREVVYTNWLFNLSGGTIRVIQEWLDYRVMVDFFILVYAWLFSYLLYFAPILLLTKDDRVNLRNYAIAMVFNYAILIPFYLLFPVSVSGSHPESGITPLLYVDTYWGKMVTSVDPLNNCFPSGHISLAVTTLLVFAAGGKEYRRFYHFLIAATICIAFSVLYLGIHWPADVFAGCLVAVAATVASRSEKIQMTVDRYVRALSQKLFREKGAEGPSPPRT